MVFREFISYIILFQAKQKNLTEISHAFGKIVHFYLTQLNSKENGNWLNQSLFLIVSSAQYRLIHTETDRNNIIAAKRVSEPQICKSQDDFPLFPTRSIPRVAFNGGDDSVVCRASYARAERRRDVERSRKLFRDTHTCSVSCPECSNG